MTMLPGHSGYLISSCDEVVVKSCLHDEARSRRLKTQAAKQARFKDPYLTAPAVLEEFQSKTSYCFIMERVAGVHPFELEDPEPVVESLAAFVGRSLESATRRGVSPDVFREKVDDVRDGILKNRLVRDALPFTEALSACATHFEDGAYLPVGYCHGDLTFCNVVVDAEGAVHLLDFLDSFVSTPLADMVKLRQDTRHRWITLFDSVDLRELDRADALLHERFSEHACYREHYGAWALLSLLRVVPYVKSPRVLQHLGKEVRRAHASADLRG